MGKGTKLDHLSSIPTTYMVEQENSQKLFSDPHTQ